MFCSKWVLLLIYIAVILTIYMAVIVENPVFSVLFLIFGFVGLCSILIMCYADYLGVLFVLVYGGAISILIMFVVMMLDLKDMQFRDGEHNNAYKHFMGGTSLLFITILSLTDDPVSHLPKLAYYRD
jgi:NADH-ubiquinone oxidoreductase chain 6